MKVNLYLRISVRVKDIKIYKPKISAHETMIETILPYYYNPLEEEVEAKGSRSDLKGKVFEPLNEGEKLFATGDSYMGALRALSNQAKDMGATSIFELKFIPKSNPCSLEGIPYVDVSQQKKTNFI